MKNIDEVSFQVLDDAFSITSVAGGRPLALYGFNFVGAGGGGSTITVYDSSVENMELHAPTSTETTLNLPGIVFTSLTISVGVVQRITVFYQLI